MTKNDFVGVEFCDEDPSPSWGQVEITELTEICKEMQKRGKRYAKITDKYPMFASILSKIPERLAHGKLCKSYSSVLLPGKFRVKPQKSRNRVIALILYEKE